MVYFLQAGQDGPIKVGYSRDPDARRIALQTSHYETLNMVAVIEGDCGLEKALHQRFKGARLSGEWFRITRNDVAEAIALAVRGEIEYEPEPEPEIEPEEFQFARAQKLIIELLEEHGDWFPATELEKTLIELGICERNVRAARGSLRHAGRIERRKNGNWQWRIALKAR